MTEEKIETCFVCNQKFDMNKAELGYYRYGKYPICDFCADFYRFFNEDLTSKKRRIVFNFSHFHLYRQCLFF